MCYIRERLPSKDEIIGIPPVPDEHTVLLRDLLAETEALLERIRAKKAELLRRLDSKIKFARVMEILLTYLRRQHAQQQVRLTRRHSSTPPSLLVLPE